MYIWQLTSIMNTHYIYSLSCPLTFQVLYIGQTTCINARVNMHLNTPSKSKIANRIRQIKDFDLLPIINILDFVPSFESFFWEVYYMNLFKSWGFNLLNTQLKYKKAIL